MSNEPDAHAPLTPLFLGFVLVALTLIVYSPSFDFPFTYFDDQAYVTENQHVLGGFTADNVRWAFTTGDCGNWHPLTWLSLQLDATLFGSLNAGAFHRTNVLLHATSVLILFIVLSRMTGRLWRSAIVAALFALHPLNVEPVAWVAERKGVLSTLFWMLTLAAYLVYVRRPSLVRYLLVVLTLVLGLMSKPSLVTLPFVLLLLDYWPLRRWASVIASASPELPSGHLSNPSRRYLVMEKIPLFAVVLTASIVAYVTQERVGALSALSKYPLDLRILNAMQSYALYLGKLFSPMRLAANYPHPGASLSVSLAVGASALLAFLTMLFVVAGRRRPYLAVGWLWYVITLLPMIGLVQISDRAMADRYAYVPMIGLFILLTWGIADLAESGGLSRALSAALVVVILSFCCVRTWKQVGVWKNDETLWENALNVTGNNALAHNNLAMHYYRQGRLLLAGKQFAAAVAEAPDSPMYQHNLATLLRTLGRPEEALTPCRKALALDPGDAAIHLTLGNLLRDLGQQDEALPQFRTAVELEPNNAIYHGNLANLLLDLGQREEAKTEYRKAIELDAAYPSPHVGLGSVLAEQGKQADAQTEFRRALELDPRNAAAQFNLALLLQAEGRLTDALSAFREALEYGYVQALSSLRACERMAKLRPRLPELLAERYQPADNAERIAFAELCSQPFEARYAVAARLYADAFRTSPVLADDLRSDHRTSAAFAAARAGCGLDRDDTLTDADKARLRRQAREWLQADLRLWKIAFVEGNPEMRVALRQTLRLWQHSDAMAGVRDPAALAKLPEAERMAWQKFWREVETLARDVASAPRVGLSGR